MYWICLSREELDDILSAIDGFMQYDYFDYRQDGKKFEALSEKLEFFRDHENQAKASEGQAQQEGG